MPIAYHQPLSILAALILVELDASRLLRFRSRPVIACELLPVATAPETAFLHLLLAPYSWSEVVHRAGDESIFQLSSVSGPRIVNNFAASASSGYEYSLLFREDESFETFEPGDEAWVGERILQIMTNLSGGITSFYKDFAGYSRRRRNLEKEKGLLLRCKK
jgi:hypothetical protein